MLLLEQHRLWLDAFQYRLIDRNDVVNSFQDYFESKCEVIKPFLLTMLWGFAETGYGNYRTNLYISRPENVDLIKSAIDAVRLREFEKGFKLLKKIKFLGVSYIDIPTKRPQCSALKYPNYSGAKYASQTGQYHY